ncbi:TPA: MATE family efflux transporter [Streptococcus suis]
MKQESLGKEIIRLALPATVENIFQTLVGFVDTLLIAQLGLVAVTAVGLANTILNVYLAVYMALGVGATALIARSIGAGDRESLTFHVRQALVLSVGLGLLFGLLSLVFGRQMLVLMGADAESLAGALQGLGDTKSPLYSTVIGMWGLRVSGVIVLGQMFGLGIAGVWLSILIDLLLRAIFLTWRFIVQTRKLAD